VPSPRALFRCRGDLFGRVYLSGKPLVALDAVPGRIDQQGDGYQRTSAPHLGFDAIVPRVLLHWLPPTDAAPLQGPPARGRRACALTKVQWPATPNWRSLQRMKQARSFVVSTLISGLITVIPVYLALLLLLKAMGSVLGLVRPIARLLPEWFPAENVLALLLLLVVCFLVGVAVRTAPGRAARERLEKSLFSRLPGFALVRSLTQQITGRGDERVWKPALVEIEDALVPAFIIEELEDGRMTVFVPSVPTPLAGAVYVLDRQRVHILNVPFTQAVSTISRWGAGSRELVAAMQRGADGADLERGELVAGAPRSPLST